jgi:hypothetical protein
MRWQPKITHNEYFPLPDGNVRQLYQTTRRKTKNPSFDSLQRGSFLVLSIHTVSVTRAAFCVRSKRVKTAGA